MFKILKKSNKSSARIGKLQTKHGVINTPFFMPTATKGSIKALTSDDLKKLDLQILLSNTYHLYLQPGLKVLKKFKGLHKFMNWNGPILTDSGGYQVFSLGTQKQKNTRLPSSGTGGQAKTKKYFKDNVVEKNLVRITKRGVQFKSYLDGGVHLFTPEKVQEIQDIIGSDIKMVLDVCSPHPCSKGQAERDMQITHDWASRSLKHRNTKTKKQSMLFSIIQGSTFKSLRLKSAKYLSELDFDGYAIGGLAVGESAEKMYQVLDWVMPELPEDKPHYLMGVGKPEQMVEAIKKGIDMFDCVIPTREARHGRLYIRCHPELVSGSRGKRKEANFYKIINIHNSKYKNSTQPIDKNCTCELCKNYSAGYLQHLFKAQEPLALRLATLHNLTFYIDLFKDIRNKIKNKEL